MDSLKETIDRYGVYFEELRSRILLLTKIFVIVFALGFFATSPAIRFILSRLNLEGVTIVTTSPFQLVELAMSVGFFFACMVTVPIFVYSLYLFLKPGLLLKERSIFVFMIPFGMILFLVGFSYGAFMLYYGTKIIAKVNVGLGVANYWDISTFISQIVMTSSLLGLLFLFPLVITFLVRLEIISINFLKSKRRHAIAIIFVIVSLLPPTDGLSLILMAAPLILIFEMTVLFNRMDNYGRKLLK